MGKKGLFLKDNMEIETEEEKMLKKIVVEEGDAVRNLANLPLESEIYRIKLQELQPLINYRVELEKIVQEQRFSRMREDYHPYSTVNFNKKLKFTNVIFFKKRKPLNKRRSKLQINSGGISQQYQVSDVMIISKDFSCIGISFWHYRRNMI